MDMDIYQVIRFWNYGNFKFLDSNPVFDWASSSKLDPMSPLIRIALGNIPKQALIQDLDFLQFAQYLAVGSTAPPKHEELAVWIFKEPCPWHPVSTDFTAWV